MKKHLVCAIALTGLLVACATPVIWKKDGATEADYKRDSYDCENRARQSPHFDEGLIGTLYMKEFYKECMNSRGYTLGNQ